MIPGNTGSSSFAQNKHKQHHCGLSLCFLYLIKCRREDKAVSVLYTRFTPVHLSIHPSILHLNTVDPSFIEHHFPTVLLCVITVIVQQISTLCHVPQINLKSVNVQLYNSTHRCLFIGCSDGNFQFAQKKPERKC